MLIQPHFHALNKGGKGRLPLLFLKIRKVSWFWKERRWLWSAFAFIEGRSSPTTPIAFCKTLYFKCLTVFWIRLCLNNCSRICTVTLCIYCIRHIHNSLCFFRCKWCMPAQMILLLTRRNICKLVGWEEYNTGRICTPVFNICTLLLNKKNQYSISAAEK